MANYTVEQFYQMIDKCYTPEFLIMEKAMKRQRYIDIFTEMHNYISENIIELPFDAEVFTEEDDNVERKSVWDKNKKGWSGFWENVWAVIKNIWNNFWRFIRSIGSYNDTVKPQEAKKIADKAEEVAKEVEQKSEQEVKEKIEEKKEEVKQVVEKIINIEEILESTVDDLEKSDEKIKEYQDKQTAAGGKGTNQRIDDALRAAENRQKRLLKGSDNIKEILQKIKDNPSSLDKAKVLALLNTLKDYYDRAAGSKTTSAAPMQARSACITTMGIFDIYFNLIKYISSETNDASLRDKAKAIATDDIVFKWLTGSALGAHSAVKLYLTTKKDLTASLTATFVVAVGGGTYAAGFGSNENVIKDIFSDISQTYTLLVNKINGENLKYKIDNPATFEVDEGKVNGISEPSKSPSIGTIPDDLKGTDVTYTGTTQKFTQAVMQLVTLIQIPFKDLGSLVKFKDRSMAKYLNDAIDAIQKVFFS